MLNKINKIAAGLFFFLFLIAGNINAQDDALNHDTTTYPPDSTIVPDSTVKPDSLINPDSLKQRKRSSLNIEYYCDNTGYIIMNKKIFSASDKILFLKKNEKHTLKLHS